jgi:PAS domain S-box-containing protein
MGSINSSQAKHKEAQSVLHRNLGSYIQHGYAYYRKITDEDNNVDFIYEEVNENYEKLTGLKDVIGRRMTETRPGLSKSNPMFIEKYARVAETGIPDKFEIFLETDNHWYDVSLYSPQEGYVLSMFDDISERKKSEETLKKSEERFRRLFENDSIVILLDPDTGNIIDANHAAAEFYGWSVEQLKQMSIRQITSASSDEVKVNMDKVRTSKQNQFLFRHRRADGSLRDVEVFSNRIELEGKDILYAIIHDVTARILAENQLQKLSVAVEQSPAIVVITDPEGNIEYVNPAFTLVTGYSTEEATGQNPRILKSGLMPPSVYEELWKTILSGNVWYGELQNKKKNGELYWDQAVISAIRNKKNVITNFVAVKVDITEQKKMFAELIAAKQKAEESDRLKSAFLANISHEIRTPMNGILGFAQLLKEPHLTGEEQTDYIDLIQQSGVRMLNLINNLINVSRIEAGEIMLQVSETPVNELLRDLYAFFKPEIDKKGLRLQYTTGLPDSESVIETDSGKLIQILTNLIQNALKFTSSGEIDFGYNRIDGTLEFYVIDSGIGIAPEMKAKIFHRFHQVDNTLTRNQEGSGLGLNISKAYVELLGGTIRVESREGQGSEFYFTLPYRHIFAQNIRIPSPVIQKPVIIAPAITVLIAEDDAVSSLLLKKNLAGENINTIFAVNGVEAIEMVRQYHEIDIVLMDIKMPLMNGYEATRLIKELRPDLPVIIQTAFTSKEERENAKKAGCDGYITKPINKIELHKLMLKLLNR